MELLREKLSAWGLQSKVIYGPLIWRHSDRKANSSKQNLRFVGDRLVGDLTKDKIGIYETDPSGPFQAFKVLFGWQKK